MPKNIIICSDGTGNTAIKNRGTNVFKIFEAIDLNGHRIDPNLDPQVAFYDDGVGTETFHLIGAFWVAPSAGILEERLPICIWIWCAFMIPAKTPPPAKSQYLFGFGRGAFTVRTLAGLIAKCGVLDRDKLHTTDALRAAMP